MNPERRWEPLLMMRRVLLALPAPLRSFRSLRAQTRKRSGGTGVGDVEAVTSTHASAAEIALRCSSMLRGGVAPSRALARATAETGADREAGIAGRITGGLSPPEALAARADPEWRILAVAWRLAEQSGAPLTAALHRIGSALRELERLRERREVLLAGPRATVRLVSSLPPLALLLGSLLGFDPLPVLLSPIGAVLLGSGAVLLAAGVAWSRSLHRSVAREDRVDGIELELVWIALGGGAPPATARLRTVDAVDSLGAEWVPFAAFESSGLLARTLDVSSGIGTPLRPLLLEEAGAARMRSHAELERAAEKLGVRVLVPLGVCVLPAFIVLGVVPVLIAMLGV